MADHRSITILGSTGSIGRQTLDVLTNLHGSFTARWLTCNSRWEDLAEQVLVHRPHGVAIREEAAWKAFTEHVDFDGVVLCGEEGLCEAAADSENSVVMSAMVGFSGVVPTMAAVHAGHTIGLANKESLVSAGHLIMPAARQHGATVIAVDSEHSAILQCLVGERRDHVSRFIITASGGPFRMIPLDELDKMTWQQALQHPNWIMGNKITIDSATLMNKGFEVMEAHWLFDAQAEEIDVVIHPQSIIHSMVQFIDGSVKAQMGVPTMMVPIQYALTYPERRALEIESMDLAQMGSLTFERPDTQRFPCLKLAYDALQSGGSAGCVINAANEVAVHAFLHDRLRFTDIPRLIESSLEHMEHLSHPSLTDIVDLDARTREFAEAHTTTFAD
jgi:1-deoxy-D-xylulose-5-phosphate reductoisomerase